MTLANAIRRLQRWSRFYKPEPNDTFYESIQLGIEAMKFVKAQYDPDHQMMRKLLPGETEE